MAAPSKYALCKLDDVRGFLGYEDDDVTRDDDIQRAINAVSLAIPRRAQRNFVTTTREKAQRRFVRIEPADVSRGYVRVGDMSEAPTEALIWTPDRDSSTTLDVDNDIFLLPDTPDPGFPFEYVWVKSTASAIIAGYWLSVKTDWGFPELPFDIVQVAVGSAASWVLNDVLKQTELARAAGRRVKFESLIPEEYVDTVNSYRLLRVS